MSSIRSNQCAWSTSKVGIGQVKIMKEFFEKIENLYIFMALGQVGEQNYGKDWEWLNICTTKKWLNKTPVKYLFSTILDNVQILKKTLVKWKSSTLSQRQRTRKKDEATKHYQNNLLK